MNSIAELVKQVQELTELTQAQATEIARLKAACDAQGELTQKYQALALEAAQAAPQQHAQVACNYPLCKSEAEQRDIADDVHSRLYGNVQAAQPIAGNSQQPDYYYAGDLSPEICVVKLHDSIAYGHQCRAAALLDSEVQQIKQAEASYKQGRAAGVVEAINLLLRNAEIDGFTGASVIRALNKTEG